MDDQKGRRDLAAFANATLDQIWAKAEHDKCVNLQSGDSLTVVEAALVIPFIGTEMAIEEWGIDACRTFMHIASCMIAAMYTARQNESNLDPEEEKDG